MTLGICYMNVYNSKIWCMDFILYLLTSTLLFLLLIYRRTLPGHWGWQQGKHYWRFGGNFMLNVILSDYPFLHCNRTTWTWMGFMLKHILIYLFIYFINKHIFCTIPLEFGPIPSHQDPIPLPLALGFKGTSLTNPTDRIPYYSFSIRIGA